MQNEANHLSNLPDELKLILFSYINTFDLLQISELLPEYERFIYDKRLMSAVNFYKENRLDSTFLKKISLNANTTKIITSLNINCIYWIESKVLLSCIKKLQMLECLYVVGTGLNVAHFDTTVATALPHLTTLAVSIEKCETEDVNMLPVTLKELCLVQPYEDGERVNFSLWKYTELEKITIVNLSVLPLRIELKEDEKPPNLQKVVMFYSNPRCISHFTDMIINGVVTFDTTNSGKQTCIESITSPVTDLYHKPNLGNLNWQLLLTKYNMKSPFGYKDSKKLVSKKCTIQHIYFEEINFRHKNFNCTTELRANLSYLLLSKNFKFLKKLSINNCLCREHKQRPNEDGRMLFKKRRIGLTDSSSGNSILERAINNSPMLTTLEIWECNTPDPSKAHQITNEALSTIKNLKFLQKLTLVGLPLHSTYKFLIDICLHCQKLESLRITSQQENANLNNYLCLALPHAKALKDFRFEQDYIPIGRIVEALCAIKDNLERVFLSCNRNGEYTSYTFESFLNDNTRLRFLYIKIGDITLAATKSLQMVLKRYVTGCDKVFVISKVANSRAKVPVVHYTEMLCCNTTVGVLDIFNHM